MTWITRNLRCDWISTIVSYVAQTMTWRINELRVLRRCIGIVRQDKPISVEQLSLRTKPMVNARLDLRRTPSARCTEGSCGRTRVLRTTLITHYNVI